MEIIRYREVELDVVDSIVWEREPLMDQAGGTTYECTRIRGSVIVTYNPGAISYRFRDQMNEFAPPPFPGKFPEETDREIRRYLEQPRGKLEVISAGVVWLSSPIGEYVCDVRNGPFMRVNSIAKIPGERLWQIHLEFETYINEFPRAGKQKPLIVSNRWYAYDDTNWQHLRTRVYQGTCTVRGDVLQAEVGTDKFIDSLRSSFCAFTIPKGFQRENVKVTVTPDGNTAHYTITDVEQLFNKSDNCPAVRINVSDTTWTWRGSVGRAFRQVGGVAGLGSTFIGNAVNLLAAGETGIGNFITGSADQVNRLANAGLDNLPKSGRNVNVECWGNQRTKRISLVNYALAVVNARLGQQFAMNTYTSELIVSQDTQNFVSVKLTLTWGLDLSANILGGAPGAAAQGVINLNDAAIAQTSFVAGIGASPNTTAGGYTLTQSDLLLNVPFPASNGTRGTAAVAPSSPSLQTLLTQVLEGFNKSPAAVP